MDKKILRPEFDLHKVKLMKNDGGVELHYTIISKDSGATHEDFSLDKKTTVPHPDFIESIRSLDKYLMTVMGHNDILIVSKNHMLGGDTQKAFNDVKPVIEKMLAATLDRYTVNGVSISGDPEKKQLGVIIMAKYACANGIDVAQNTPLIKLQHDKEKFGIELALAEAIDRVKEEAFCYLFENKKASLDDIARDRQKQNIKESKKGKPAVAANQTSLTDADQVDNADDKKSDKKDKKKKETTEVAQ